MEIDVSWVVGTVGSNAAAIAYIVYTLHSHRSDIKELFNKVNDTMTKTEIAEMVRLCNEPIKEVLDETKVSIKVMSENVNVMAVTVAIMNERIQIRRDADDRNFGRRAQDEVG